MAQIYVFLTWHILTITGTFSLKQSLALAFPSFYLGLGSSIAMLVVYFLLAKK